MRYVLLLACICMLRVSYAQDLSHVYQNWYAVYGNAKINNKWAVPFDVQLRLRDGISGKGQLLMRAGLQYSLDKQNSVLLGYAYAPTYSAAVNAWLPEQRIFQQFTHKEKKLDMRHRVRLEQRWVAQPNPVGPHMPVKEWSYGNRLRYYNRTQIPIRHKHQATPFFVALQDELFMNLWGNSISNLFFDQNRLLMAVGYQFNATTKVDLGYMNQLVQVNSGDKTMNHILHMGVSFAFDL